MMTDDPSRRRLGRGLAALIGEMDKPAPAPNAALNADRQVPIELILRNPRNPRRSFSETDLVDLSQSIRTHGIVQPIIVRRSLGSTDTFEIVAGERRWRAAQIAGLTAVPVIIRDIDDRVALEIAIVENVQRSDLNPIEEAQGYQQLVDEHSYTQLDLAGIIGKSRSHVANTLRLLKLPETVRDMLVNNQLSAGHARALIAVDDPLGLARKIVSEGLSVRQAEQLAQDASERPKLEAKQGTGVRQKDLDTSALEKLISDHLGMRVAINHTGSGGTLSVKYSILNSWMSCADACSATDRRMPDIWSLQENQHQKCIAFGRASP
jgi:ParB family transcriptional regulator, chromosome partitioning protein